MPSRVVPHHTENRNRMRQQHLRSKVKNVYYDPRGGAIFDPRGKIGRIYVELHMTMLYIKYTSFVSCCCREDFFLYFHCKSKVDNDMPGAWPVWTPGAPLAAFIKDSIIHWSTQHMKALGHMVSEKKIFLCFSHDAPGARLAGFIKRTTIHCYKQNMKALGLVVSEKKIFYVLPMTPPPPWGTVGRIYKEDH